MNQVRGRSKSNFILKKKQAYSFFNHSISFILSFLLVFTYSIPFPAVIQTQSQEDVNVPEFIIPEIELSNQIPEAKADEGDCANGSDDQISQYGITWNFDHEYPCGQYTNGDYWVVGPATIESVTPSPERYHQDSSRACTSAANCSEYTVSCTPADPNQEGKCLYTRFFDASFYPSVADLSQLPESYMNENQVCRSFDSAQSKWVEDLTICTDNKKFYDLAKCVSNKCTYDFARNGIVVNPRYKKEQGYDSRAVSYDHALNKIIPLQVIPGDSVLSSVSLSALTDKSYLSDMAVLTIVDEVQPADRFRPPYTRPVRIPDSTNDGLSFSVNNVNWDYLPKVDAVAAAPSLESSALRLQRPNMVHFASWEMGEVRAINGLTTYGREVARAVSDLSLQLMLNYSNEEKKPVLVNLIQLGIDLYGVYLDGGKWESDGGIFCGRKWPLLFAGIMLNNDMKNVGNSTFQFHEDGQTFYVSANEIYTQPYQLNSRSDWQYGDSGYARVTQGSVFVEGIGTNWTNSRKAGPDWWFGIKDDVEAYKVNSSPYQVKAVVNDTQLELKEPYQGETNLAGNAYFKTGNWFVWYGHGNAGKEKDFIEYTTEHLGMPEWGIEHDDEPDADGLDWDANYRRCCNANSWAGFILAIHMMNEKTGARTLWNHQALFDYQDRYMEVEESLGTKGTWMRQWEKFHENMWDTYRKDYGCVWTRSNKSDPYSNGYYECDGAAVDCKNVSSCVNYPNQRACNYDPCNFGCNGVCGAPDPVCGNSIIESGEACDDGDTENGDGCTSVCAVEDGYTCNNDSGASICTVALQIPSAPTNLSQGGVTQNSIVITWTDNSDNETGFKIERKEGNDGVYSEIATVNVNVTSYQDTGLTSGTEYFYRVRATNSAGNSEYTEAISATTQEEVSCTDGIKNGDEEGIDCGGSCEPCQVGAPTIEEVLPLKVQEGAVGSIPVKIGYAGTNTLTVTCKLDDKALTGNDYHFGFSYSTTSNQATFSYYTRPGDAGIHTVQITASDGQTEATRNIHFEVEPVPAASNASILISNLVSGTLVESRDFTLSIEENIVWGSAVNIFLLYKDSNNYYKLNTSGGKVLVTRVMDGKSTVIGRDDEQILSAIEHGRGIWGKFKIHVAHTENGIQFEVGRNGVGGNYDFSVTDKDTSAVSRFDQGQIMLGPTGSSKLLSAVVYGGRLNEFRVPFVYYVGANNGSDTNDGLTILKSFKTIARATRIALAGDMIKVAGGIYREAVSFVNSGSENEPITIQALDRDDRPVIDGSNILLACSAPDSNNISSCPEDVVSDVVFKNGVRMSVAMDPDVIDSEDPYNHSRWYRVENESVVVSGSEEENEMINKEVEYLTLDDRFRRAHGVAIGNDYWVGASIYHYNHYANTTLVRKILAYDAQKNRVEVPLVTSAIWGRFLAPEGTRYDYYSVVNHYGVLDSPYEYASDETNKAVYLYSYDPSSTMEGMVRDSGVLVNKHWIVIDGVEVERHSGTGVSQTGSFFTLNNSYVHNNMGSGFGSSGPRGVFIYNSEFSYNDQNGISVGRGSLVRFYGDYVHHNNNNGIWIGGGVVPLWACTDIEIKNCRVEFQGSSQSHPDNIQFHQIADLLMEDNHLEQAGHQNMWCQQSSRITMRHNTFVNGTLGLCQMSPAYFYNNVFDHSGLRFDAHQGTPCSQYVGAIPYDSTTKECKKDQITIEDSIAWGGWGNFIKDIQGDIANFPLNLLWNTSLSVVNEIRALPAGTTTLSDPQKTQIFQRINEVVDDLGFYARNFSVYDSLDKNKMAVHIIDSVIARGIMDPLGNLKADLTFGETVEVKNVTRAILDELVLDNRIAKHANPINYRPRHVEIKNNIMIENSISAPPADLEMKPYFDIDYNYFNIESSWLTQSWTGFPNAGGMHSIWEKYDELLVNQLADVSAHDYHLLPSSDLIDAGVDVGLPFYSVAPDMGRYEYQGIGGPRITSVQGLDRAVQLKWRHIVPDAIDYYKVWRADSEEGPFSAINDHVTTMEYTDTPLTNGITYYYRVTAVSGSDESAPSNTVNGKATVMWGQDNFEDYVTWGSEHWKHADPNLLNGMTWEIEPGSVISTSSLARVGALHKNYWLAPGINVSQPVTIYSSNELSLPFEMSFEDYQAYVADSAGALVLYQDSNNHYRIQISRYDFKIWRVMDGVVELVGEAKPLAMQHAPSSATFTVNVSRQAGGIVFSCRKSDWIKSGTMPTYDLNVYTAAITDSNATAIEKFTQGRAGFYQFLTGTYNVPKYDNVSIVQIDPNATPNTPPVAKDQTIQINEDTPVEIVLEAEDIETSSQNLLYRIFSGPIKGTVNAENTKTFVYTPQANYFGSDVVAFKASDGVADSVIFGKISINITSVNDRPIAKPILVQTEPNNVLEISLDGEDAETAKENLVYSIVSGSGPVKGGVVLNGSLVTYTPESNDSGMYTFKYKASDGELESEEATVTIMVGSGNQPPIAKDQNINTDEDAPVVITLSGEDLEMPAERLSYAIVSGPSKGLVNATNLQTFTYTPNANYSGTDTITFKVNDGFVDSVENGTVTITVVAQNDDPVASLNYFPRSPKINESVMFNASGSTDADGNGTIVKYEWDFGDGNFGEGRSVSHFFPEAKDYTIRLVVTDDKGATGEASETIAIEPAGTPNVKITSPVDGSRFKASPITVVYTVDGVEKTDENVSLVEGANQIRRQSSNAAGTGFDEITVYLDTVRPVVTISTNTTKTKTPAFLVVGAVAEAQGLKQVLIKVNSAEPVTAEVNGNSFSKTVTLSEGMNTVTVTAEDVAGNASDPVSKNFTLDTVPPTLTVNPVTTPTKESAQTVTGTKEADTSVKLNGSEIVSRNMNTAWSYDVTLNEGNNSFAFASIDEAGNESSPVTVVIVRDSQGPAITITSPAHNSIINDSTPLLSYDTDGTVLNVTLDGSLISTRTGSDLDLLSEGQHQIGVTAEDSLHNQSTASSTFTYVPQYVITVNRGTGSGTFNKNSAITISANAPDKGYEFKEWIIVSGTSTIQDKNSTTTQVVLLSDTTVEATFRPDVTPPVITITSPQNNQTLTSKTVRVLGVTNEPVQYVKVNGLDATLGAAYQSFEISLDMSEGTNSLIAYGVDNAGNAAFSDGIQVAYHPDDTTNDSDSNNADSSSSIVVGGGGGGIIMGTNSNPSNETGDEQVSKSLSTSNSKKADKSLSSSLFSNSSDQGLFSSDNSSVEEGEAFIYIIGKGAANFGAHLFEPKIEMDLQGKTEEIKLANNNLVLPRPDHSQIKQNQRKNSQFNLVNWAKEIFKRVLFWIGFKK